MKYFRNPVTGEVFAFESDGSQDEYIPDEILPMSADEVTQHLAPKVTNESERSWRDAEFAGLVWLRDRHRDQLEIGAAPALTAEQFTELLRHMQSLRDWPQSEHFPAIEHRPLPPSWLAEQARELWG